MWLVVSDTGFDQGCGLWPGCCVAQRMMWSLMTLGVGHVELNDLGCWACGA